MKKFVYICRMHKADLMSSLAIRLRRVVSEITNKLRENMSNRMKTVFLLLISNIFMTFAWYGHLRFKKQALWLVIIISWGIAFFEYAFHIPANRIGHGDFTAPQLKVVQEVIALTVFGLFSIFYLKEKPTSYDNLSFVLIIAALCVSIFQPKVS